MAGSAYSQPLHSKSEFVETNKHEPMDKKTHNFESKETKGFFQKISAYLTTSSKKR
jgi:hypothetical protein